MKIRNGKGQIKIIQNFYPRFLDFFIWQRTDNEMMLVSKVRLVLLDYEGITVARVQIFHSIISGPW